MIYKGSSGIIILGNLVIKYQFIEGILDLNLPDREYQELCPLFFLLPVILTTINKLVTILLINIENDSIVINNSLHQSFIDVSVLN